MHVSFRLWCASAPYRTKFSFRVLPAYNYTCALTRYRMIAINRASRSGMVTSSSIAFLVAVHGVVSFAKANFMCWLPMPGYTPISRDA